MEGSEHGPSPAPASADSSADRLDSWKEIAAYLRRNVRTVQRWEQRERMPVHRHQHAKQGSVYAFRSEIDAWWESRRPDLEDPPRVRSDDGAGSSAVPLTGPEAGSAGLRRPLWLAFVGLIAVAAGGLSYGLLQGGIGESPDPAITSLVVLPLEELSGDPAQEYFADGLTDELIGSLAQIRALRVVSRTTAMSLKGSSKSLPVIASELDVDGALEGTVQRDGDRVRIRVQLLHAPTDSHLWARDYERPLTDILKLQSEVAQAVAEEIRARITPEERARMTSVAAVNPEAYEEYLLGRYLLWKFIEADRLRAIEHFTRATEIDPGYAAPYAGLAHAWWMRGVFGPLTMKEAAEPARVGARKALALDDRLAEAHAAQAYVQGMFDWDWTGAERTIRRAVDLDPNSLDAHYVYALLLMALGRLDEATTQIERAARLDPLSAQVHSTSGRILYRARRFEEAVARLERAIELEPRNAGTYARMGDVYEQMGDYPGALAYYEKATAAMANPAGSPSAGIARVYARMGRRDEARQMLARLGKRAPDVYAALGDKDTAFALLFESVDRHDDWSLYIKSDPPFDTLRSDPRWAELLGRMNFPTGRAATTP